MKVKFLFQTGNFQHFLIIENGFLKILQRYYSFQII